MITVVMILKAVGYSLAKARLRLGASKEKRRKTTNTTNTFQPKCSSSRMLHVSAYQNADTVAFLIWKSVTLPAVFKESHRKCWYCGVFCVPSVDMYSHFQGPNTHSMPRSSIRKGERWKMRLLEHFVRFLFCFRLPGSSWPWPGCSQQPSRPLQQLS